MKRFLIVSALTLGLASCAQLTADYNAITGATVSPTAVIVAGNAFDAVEATGKNYLRLPKCTATNGPVCRNPTATAQIIPAMRAGRQARTALENFMQQNPGPLGSTGLYSALTTATSTLEQIFTTYNIK